ncbi:DUF4124 domain-containing protein [Colwellia sp. E2M01]|uniref:DUF4124 domain-containing protein n=1 Tax=Colwellia sp. E2M01 TaxID=2841561 RepID=UPI001C091217|nr:DUF4124 domain-containing protein [Colwellia sp. E2M01]MBU2869410.1 DUF4124 domain-containing protein [Colwellia sp. E2M01]
MIFFKALKVVNNLVLTSYLLSFSLHAEVYTWTDTDGVVHYSDKPHFEGDIEQFQPAGDPNLSEPVNPNSQWQQDFQQAQQAKKKQAIKKYETETEKQRYCDSLKSNLAIYQQGGRLYTMSPDGERTYTSDQELADKTKHLIKQIKTKC